MVYYLRMADDLLLRADKPLGTLEQFQDGAWRPYPLVFTRSNIWLTLDRVTVDEAQQAARRRGLPPGVVV